MKKNSIIICLLCILVSCGVINKTKTRKQTDSTSTENNSKRTINYLDNSKYTLEPVDLSKPMFFKNEKGETQTYYNTKVIHDKTQTIQIVKDTTSRKTKLIKDESDKNKQTDNQTIWFMFFGFLLVLLLIKNKT